MKHERNLEWTRVLCFYSLFVDPVVNPLSPWLIIQTPVVQIQAFSARENGERKEIKQSINERKWVNLWHDNLYLG